MRGKEKCKYLREIRKRIATENDIRLVTEECTYKGECKGTCPKCEAEVRYLESELDKRQEKGKIITLAGLSLAGIAGSSLLASCDPPMGKSAAIPEANEKAEASFFITENGDTTEGGDTILGPGIVGEVDIIDEGEIMPLPTNDDSTDEAEYPPLAPEACPKTVE